MLKKIKAYISTNALLTPGDTVVLGVSGGADSVALLLVLSELRAELGINLRVVHVNHGIRGAEAASDQAFTEELCKRLQVPLKVVCEDVPALAAAEGLGLEEAGRKVRYRAFEQEALRTGAEKIAVAHHMDDNAETLLFRLARGTGIKGLAGMAPKRVLTPQIMLIRPLLCVRRYEIENWLQDRTEHFCIDSTNLDSEYSRNSIRNQILPLLEQMNAGTVDNICALAEQAARTEEYLQKQAENLYGDCIEFGKNSEILIRIPKAAESVLFERILRNALFKAAKHEKDITALHIKLLYGLCSKQTGSKISLPYGVTAEKSYDCLLLKKEADGNTGDCPKISENTVLDRDKLEAGEVITVAFGDYGFFDFSICEKSENSILFSKQDYTKYFDYDKMKDTVEIHRARGEETLAIGVSGGTKDLKKLFTDCKIPKAERESLPIISDGSNILWIPGVRTGENRRVDDTTQNILKIEWRSLW